MFEEKSAHIHTFKSVCPAIAFPGSTSKIVTAGIRNAILIERRKKTHRARYVCLFGFFFFHTFPKQFSPDAFRLV